MVNQRALSVGFDDSTTRKRRMNIAELEHARREFDTEENVSR
jgi:hypothetical protein